MKRPDQQLEKNPLETMSFDSKAEFRALCAQPAAAALKQTSAPTRSGSDIDLSSEDDDNMVMKRESMVGGGGCLARGMIDSLSFVCNRDLCRSFIYRRNHCTSSGYTPPPRSHHRHDAMPA